MRLEFRKLMMAGLVSAFVGQTILVYTDPTSDANARLSELALEGRAIWHVNNCVTCHQLYGFGGFLGPDLTNAASRVNRERLDDVLTVGSLQMPAFGLSPREIDAVEAFLVAMDATGVGQVRCRQPISWRDVHAAIEAHIQENPMGPEAARGRQMFSIRCISCHTPFCTTPLGMVVAPDLAGVSRRLTPAEISAVLIDGRPTRGMPVMLTTAEERVDVTAFLGWLAEHEAVLRPRFGDGAVDGGLSWFEFR